MRVTARGWGSGTVAALLVAASALADTGGDQVVDAFVQTMIGEVGGVVSECPQELHKGTSLGRFTCAKVSRSFDLFKTLWDLVYSARFEGKPGHAPLSAWAESGGGGHMRVYSVNGRRVAVAHVVESRVVWLIVVVFDDSGR